MGYLSWDDRKLGWLLGLEDLTPRRVCHGYSNACVCCDCLERVQNAAKSVETPAQPWEPRKTMDVSLHESRRNERMKDPEFRAGYEDHATAKSPTSDG